MSADNFVGVRPNPKELTYSIFEYGNMSVYEEDCMYYADERGEEVTGLTMTDARATALVRAHDLVNAMSVCEYGVVEMQPVPDKPCGRCWVCINERGIVGSDVQRCDRCSKPISSTDWQVMKFDAELERTVTLHSRCERI